MTTLRPYQKEVMKKAEQELKKMYQESINKPTPPSKKLAERIKQVRTAQGLNMTDFAESLNFNYSYCWDLEKGRKNPSWAIIDRIFEKYGVDITERLTEKTE